MLGQGSQRFAVLLCNLIGTADIEPQQTACSVGLFTKRGSATHKFGGSGGPGGE